MALNAQILVSIIAHESSGDGIAQTLRATPATYALALTDGTGANQAQLVWSDSRTIAAGGLDALTLSSLSDDRGSIALSQVKAIYVKNTHATATLRVGGSTIGAFGGLPATIFRALPPGGVYMVTAPTEAGFGGSEALFASDSGEVTYDIVLIGEGTVT
jgi:hypothetical protein